jgi:hypothetical protein
MGKRILVLIAWAVAAAPPAFAAYDACSSECARKQEGKDAICRAKTDPGLVKDCLASMKQDIQFCRQSCRRDKGETPPASSTAPSHQPPQPIFSPEK